MYTRHNGGCKKTSTLEGSCACPKWVRYTLNGKTVRKNLKTADYREAQKAVTAVQQQFEDAAAGKGVTKHEGPPTLREAFERFIADKKGEGNLQTKYVRRLDHELGKFVNWCDARGLMMLEDVRATHVIDFRNGLKGTTNSRAKGIRRVVGMFAHFVKLGWIRMNVADAAKIDYDKTQKPRALNEEQFEQLLAAIDRVNGRTTDEQRRKLRAIVLLMRYTGLAIRDAISIKREDLKLNGGGYWRVFLRREKTGKPAEGILHPTIVKQILKGANASGRYLFVSTWPEKEEDGTDATIRAEREHQRDILTAPWVRLMNKLGDVANLKDEHGAPYPFTSHALRHTFAIAMLTAGLPVADVGILLGDNSDTVHRHYSEWIQARQENLSTRMMAALGGPVKSKKK